MHNELTEFCESQNRHYKSLNNFILLIINKFKKMKVKEESLTKIYENYQT